MFFYVGMIVMCQDVIFFYSVTVSNQTDREASVCACIQSYVEGSYNTLAGHAMVPNHKPGPSGWY